MIAHTFEKADVFPTLYNNSLKQTLSDIEYCQIPTKSFYILYSDTFKSTGPYEAIYLTLT